MEWINKIHHGDILTIAKQVDIEVDMVMTSPP